MPIVRRYLRTRNANKYSTGSVFFYNSIGPESQTLGQPCVSHNAETTFSVRWGQWFLTAWVLCSADPTIVDRPRVHGRSNDSNGIESLFKLLKYFTTGTGEKLRHTLQFPLSCPKQFFFKKINNKLQIVNPCFSHRAKKKKNYSKDKFE